jgi:hypothetical protein
MVKKDEAMRDWQNLEVGLNPLEHMTPIPYKAEGSRYGACGIRIDGNPRFIDAVLSNLKHVLDGENQVTRLELARNTVKPTNINGTEKRFANSDNGAEVCYIRLHVRGHEGSMVKAFMGHHKGATERYAKHIR